MPQDGLHLNEVNHALEGLLSADRQLDSNRIGTQHIVHLADYLEEVGTRAVHLVHVTDTGNVIFLGLMPYGLRLGLYAAYGAERGDSTVKDAERTLYLHGEIDVAWSIDQVELVFLTFEVPKTCSGCRSDSDTALLLLNHPVHRSGAIVNLTDFVSQTGVVKNTL